MERIYLDVSPDEYSDVKASGAVWDDASKSWYIAKDTPPGLFTRWLNCEADPERFSIVSDEAMVLTANVPCLHCREGIQVICIYCASGEDTETDETLAQFTVSNIWSMDHALENQLKRWPNFQKAISDGSEDGVFANYCPSCGGIQADYLLHSEPGDVFFGVTLASVDLISSTPLNGQIHLNGDYSFEV